MWRGHPDFYMNTLEEILNTPDTNVIGYFFKVDLRYLDKIKEKTKNFPYCPENKVIPKVKQIEYAKKIKPKIYAKAKKLISGWTDKKNPLINYRLLKL